MNKKFWVLVGILVGIFILSCLVGRYDLSFLDVVQILFGQSDSDIKGNVFFQIRLPRTVLVVLAGAALSLAGFVYQSVFKNPLVSPDVLGVSSGCSIGAIMGILMTGGNAVVVQGGAFAFGFLVVCISMVLAEAIGGSKNTSMILAGIVMGALSNSVIMTLKYVADPQRQLASIEYWLMGSFSTAGWGDVCAVLPVLSLSGVCLYLLRWQLQLLTLGEEEAQSLGVDAKKVKLVCIICGTALVAAVISVAGLVAWIGLIVPHMTRLFFGDVPIKNMVQSAVFGSMLLLLADVLARSIFSAELPISIMTSLIGGIFLLFVLWHRHRKGNEEIGGMN